jgi:hypothetical protein
VWREVTGNYTLTATFRERFTAPSENPQPYGLAIGNERDDVQAYVYLYWAAYGNGTFDLGFAGPGLKPFPMNGAGPMPHPRCTERPRRART